MCSCSGNCNCNSGTIPRGPQGATGAQGPQGIIGPNGTPGSVWYQDNITPPDPTLGIDGDFYLNNSTNDVYQKISGVWTQVANLTGSATTGPQGPAGIVRLYYNTNSYQSSTSGTSFLNVSPNISANTLTTNGQALRFTMYYENRLNIGSLNQIGVKFANNYTSTGLLSTGNYPLPWNSTLDMKTFWTVELVRTSAGSVVCYNTIGSWGEFGGTSAAYNYVDIAQISGLDFTLPNIFQIEIQQQASNQITVKGVFIDLINY